jgi:Phytanoyl-CoA dioxygenase (PhyH)
MAPEDVDSRSARRAAFTDTGLVRIASAIAPAEIATMRAGLWNCLGQVGIDRDDPRTWREGGGLRLQALVGALRPGPGTDDLLWSVGRDPSFAALVPAVTRVVEQTFGANVWTPIDHGLAAPNFPWADRWLLPHEAWHVDEPTTADNPRGWALLGFVFLDDVGPGGGATVALAGSPHRLRRLATDGVAVQTTAAAIASLCAAQPGLAALFTPGDAAHRVQRFMTDDRASLRVVELTGSAGDIVLMDPRCLHTISANCSDRPRLTMRMTFGRSDGDPVEG